MATALITGASSGIGLELSRIFAANKHDLILVARSEGKLQSLAKEIRTTHKIRCDVIPQDLSCSGAASELFNKVQSLGIEVDFLVNNAGFGLFGKFSQTNGVKETEMIHLNIVALTELTKIFLPAMLARGSGRILNIASTAAFIPGPFMAVYYATKAYVLSFSEALASELVGSGVSVTALCPGLTSTGFQEAADLSSSKLLKAMPQQDAGTVAREGYDAMMCGAAVRISGFSNGVMANMPRFFPRWAVRTMMRKIQGAAGNGAGPQ